MAILTASIAPTVRLSSARSLCIRLNRQPRSAATTSSRSANRAMKVRVPRLMPLNAASYSVRVWVCIDRDPESIRAIRVATPGRGRR